MKISNLLIVTVFAATCASCINKGKNKNQASNTTTATGHFIQQDSANKMISSYLTSIGYPDSGSQLLSLTVDADQLRNYLADPDVAKVKLSFAHRLDYINQGNSGVDCGYNSNGLTLVIAAVDTNGDYVFHNGNEVMDYAAPCPSSCLFGSASNPLIVNAGQ